MFAAVSLAAFAVPVAAKSYSADRFDVTARLLPDRSLTVEERLVFRFEGGDYTYVFREIPKNRTDGVRDVEAGMDGVPFRVGDGPGSIELKEGRSVRVTWRFAPTSGIHIFTLRYRMAGVLTLDGVENVLAWRVLPGKHEYRIGYARAVVQLPPGVRLVGPPTVRPAEAEVSVRYAPDGQTPQQIVAGGQSLGRDDAIGLKVRLSPEGFASTLPIWQRDVLERSRRGPWLLVVAAAVLVLGVSWLAAFWSAWRRSSDHVHTMPSRRAVPPHPQLPVAIASRLAGAASGGPPYAATMVDLAGRGVVAIEEPSARRRLRGRQFVARLLQQPPGLRPHEAAWLDVAFGSAGTHRSPDVPLYRLQRQFARRRNAFRPAVDDEMRQAGLIDPERVHARKSLARAAIVTAVLALAGAGVAIVLVSRFGGWAAVIPVSLALVAAANAIAAGSFSIFTREGERLAQEWKAYFADVRRVAKAKEPEPAWNRSDLLAYAVAAGVGAAWARRTAGAPGQFAPPAWFHSAAGAGEDRNVSFVAFLGSHASASPAGAGASAEGGGGGGAAGGGSSGAG